VKPFCAPVAASHTFILWRRFFVCGCQLRAFRFSEGMLPHESPLSGLRSLASISLLCVACRIVALWGTTPPRIHRPPGTVLVTSAMPVVPELKRFQTMTRLMRLASPKALRWRGCAGGSQAPTGMRPRHSKCLRLAVRCKIERLSRDTEERSKGHPRYVSR
jgi:hypothetical protein